MLSNLSNNNAGNQTKSVVEKKHYEEIENRLDEMQDEIDANTESINQNAQDISGLDDRVDAVENKSTFPTLNTKIINPVTGDEVIITSDLKVNDKVTADSIETDALSVNGISFTKVRVDASQAKATAESAANKADEAYDLADAVSDELADYKSDNEIAITTATLNADSADIDSIASRTINTNDFETTNAEIDDLYVDRIHAIGELALPTIGQSYYTITVPAGTIASFAGSYITENDEIEYFYFTVTDGDVIYHQAALEVIKDISFDRETGNTKIRVKSTGAVTYISSSMNVADPTIEDGGSAYEDFSFIPQKLGGQIIRGYNDTTTETFIAGVLSAYAIIADEIHYERTVVDDLVVNDKIELPKEWNQSGNISRSSGSENQYITIQTKDGVSKPTWVSPANGTTGVLDNTSDKLITEKSIACYNGSTCDGTVYPITNLGDGTSVHGSISATCFCGNVSGTADASLASCKAKCLVDGNITVLSSDCVKVGVEVVSIGCRSNCNKRGTFIGNYAGVNSEFENNTGIGCAALANLTRGGYNTAVGYGAGELICCGNYNTAVGVCSARSGKCNFFEGNTAIGYCSLFPMCNGAYNIAIGYGAMSNTSSGTCNIAIGLHTGNKSGCNRIDNSITIGNRVCGKEDALTIGRDSCCCLTYDFIDGSLCGAKLCGNATNAWCFNGKTYACAKADILTGTAAQAHCVDIDSLTTSSYPLVMESATCELGKSGTCSITFTPSTGILETNQVSTACIENSGTTKSQCLCATCDINVDGNAYIAGDLTVCGTTTTTHSEEVVTPSENIILRDEATTPVAPGCYSGFTVVNYDGCDNDLEVGADKDGTLHVGVVGGTMEPVATRATEACMENDYVAHWDSTGIDLVTKGASCTHDLCVNGNATITGTLTANLTGNADTATNATCFNGCTYAQAKEDILSGCAADSAKLGNKAASCYIDNSSTAQTKAGNLSIGAPAACTSTSAGGDGLIISAAGNIEFYKDTPYIDFHYNKYCGDYASRIISSYTSTGCHGNLNFIVNNGKGCTTCTEYGSYCFISDGTFSGACTICASTNIYSAGCPVVTTGNIATVAPGYNCTGTSNYVVTTKVCCAVKADCITRIGQPMTWVDANTSTISSIDGVTYSCYNCSCTTQTECACGYPSNYGLVLTVNRYDEIKPWGYQIAKATGGGRFYYRDWTNSTSVSNTWCQFIDSTGGQTINGNLTIPTACGSFYGNLCGSAQKVCRNAITSNALCHLALLAGTNSADNTCIYVSSACPLTYNPATGNMYISSGSGIFLGSCGSKYTAGSAELYAPSPFIDFHYNNYCGDFSTRLINNAQGSAQLIVNNGCGTTDATQTATYCFCSNGIMTANCLNTAAIRSVNPQTSTTSNLTFMSRCCNTIEATNFCMCMCGANGKLYNPQGFVGDTYTTCNSQKICVNNKLWELCCDGHIYFEGSLVI